MLRVGLCCFVLVDYKYYRMSIKVLVYMSGFPTLLSKSLTQLKYEGETESGPDIFSTAK